MSALDSAVATLSRYTHLPHLGGMNERVTDKILMNLVQRILGLPVSDPQDEDNSYIQFFLKDVRFGFGPRRALVNIILEARCSHRELAAFVAWMEHKSHKDTTPTRKNITHVTALYLDADAQLRALSAILELPSYEQQVQVAQHASRMSHSAMNDAMELMYILPENERESLVRFKSVNDPTDTDVLLKFLVCELCSFTDESCFSRSGVPGFIFFAPPHVGCNGEDFNFMWNKLERMNRRIFETFVPLLELIYDVRQYLIEFAAITASMDMTEPKTERERYERKERRNLYKDINAKVANMVHDFRSDRDRKPDPRLDCPIIQRRLKEILLLTSGCCHKAGSLAKIVMKMRVLQEGPQCQNCNAPGVLEGVVLNACSRCKDSVYCCRECQTEDWQEHKKSCSPPSPPSSEKKANMTPQCTNCAIDCVPLFDCSVCKLVQYCGKVCQKQHWKDGNHKKFCVDKEARRPEVQGAAAPVETNACPVCLESLESAKIQTRCGHSLHSECMESLKAFGTIQACPVCRVPWL